MRAGITFIVILLSLISSPAHARHSRHRVLRYQVAQQPTFGFFPLFQFAAQAPVVIAGAITEGAARLLPHPGNCPHRSFCACGAAIDLGLNPRTHMAAASFYKYHQTSPAPNMVAVRPHHVFVLKQEVSPGMWLVADYNSGHHQSRMHVRSLHGYRIVNPHA